MLLASSAHVLSGCFVPYLELFFAAIGAPVNARAVASMDMGAGILVYRVCGSAQVQNYEDRPNSKPHLHTIPCTTLSMSRADNQDYEMADVIGMLSATRFPPH